MSAGKFQTLTDEDLQQAADEIGCDVAAIRAVCIVEAPKGPFVAEGKATILFEAHIFSKYTKRRFDATHPDISSRQWNRALYKGGLAEWDRFEKAARLDANAAMLAISMGAFQIMGFNFAACGFATVDEFFDAMNTGEREQLAAFVEFIKSRRLDDELRERRWRDFARLYNGEGFAANHYDAKLADAYAKAAGDTIQAPASAEIVHLGQSSHAQTSQPSHGANEPPPPVMDSPAAATPPVQVNTTAPVVVSPRPAAIDFPHVADSIKSIRAAVSVGSVITALTAAYQWMRANPWVVIVAFVCITALALMFMHRQTKLASIREQGKWGI